MSDQMTSAAVLTAGATVLAFSAAAAAVIETYRTRQRMAVLQALRDITGSELVAARDLIGGIAHQPRCWLKKKDRLEIRQALFIILWAVERLTAVSTAARTALATAEVRNLYSHLDSMVSSANTVLATYPGIGDFSDSMTRANRALAQLPDVQEAWGAVRDSAPHVGFGGVALEVRHESWGRRVRRESVGFLAITSALIALVALAVVFSFLSVLAMGWATSWIEVRTLSVRR